MTRTARRATERTRPGSPGRNDENLPLSGGGAERAGICLWEQAPTRPIEGTVAKRRYSDDDRATAIAAVTANGGNVGLTARQLGIPEATVRQWVKEQRHPEAAKMSEQKRGPLADSCERIAWKLAGRVEETADKAPINHAAVAFGIMVDKMRLLRDQPTTIIKHGFSDLPDDDLERELASAERAEAAAALASSGEAPPAGNPQSNGFHSMDDAGL
jgi:transposase-like protein